jgi:hypothetical protein
MNDPARQPGEHRPGGLPHLARAPGERYAGPPGATAGPVPREGLVRSLVVAGLVAAVGAVALFALALLGLGPGLIAAAGATGWAVALALVWRGASAGIPDMRARVAVAATLALVAVLVGFLLDWAWARGEGGVLDPIAYLDARWGLLPLVDIAVAAIVAGLRAR